MSILIKGMEKPTRCGKCRFFVWSPGVGQHCVIATGITFHATIDGMDVTYERNGICPLVELPPHGRLIDADALNALIDQSYPMTDRYDVHNGYAICQELIKLLHTIIEAEADE